MANFAPEESGAPTSKNINTNVGADKRNDDQYWLAAYHAQMFKLKNWSQMSFTKSVTMDWKARLETETKTRLLL